MCESCLQPSKRSQIVAVSSRDHVRGLATIWSRFPTSNPSIRVKTVEKVVEIGCSKTLVLRQNQPLLRQYHHRWRGWRLGIDSRLSPDLGHDLYSTQQHSGTVWSAANTIRTILYSATPSDHTFLDNYLHIEETEMLTLKMFMVIV